MIQLNSKNIYWVGPRLSDIKDVESIFKGAVTVFGEKRVDNFYNNSFCSFYKKRINHNNNIYSKEIRSHFNNELSKIIKEDNESYFLWYRGRPFSNMRQAILDRSICYNSSAIINILSDKLRCRLLMANYVSVLQSKLLFNFECSIQNLKKIFPGYEEFILQTPINSFGGLGTHLLNKENQNKFKFESEEYLVSPFYRKNISINQHIIIYPKEVTLLPCSVQLINLIDSKLQYCGGDFSVLDTLPTKTTEKIYENSLKIGNVLQQLGYRGVLGVDYIVLPDGEILFVEINPRFQGSTVALNKIMLCNNQMSIQEMHIDSFCNDYPQTLKKPLKSDYSIISYIHSNENLNYNVEDICKKFNKSKIEIINDGLDNNEIFEKNAYLFRLLINSRVTKISSKETIINPDII